MTRNEALEIYLKHYPHSTQPGTNIDVLVDLGILKLDPEPATAREMAISALSRAGYHTRSSIMVKVIEDAGLKIVKE